MKAAILHHDPEWNEIEINDRLNEKGIESKLVDIRDDNEINQLISCDFIINRVYASVANRDYQSNIKTLELLKYLEENGVKCINSYLTTRADYSKYFSSKLMSENNVKNPHTEYLDHINTNKINNFIETYTFPIIIKRDMGGRGEDIYKVKNEKQLYEVLNHVFSDENRKKYNAGYVIQEFLKSTKSHDARINLVDKTIVSSLGRILIPLEDGEVPWMASYSKGSKFIEYTPSTKEKELAINASKSIGAFFNTVDMTFTKDGPSIIENNPTPQYSKNMNGKKRIDDMIDLIITKEVLK